MTHSRTTVQRSSISIGQILPWIAGAVFFVNLAFFGFSMLYFQGKVDFVPNVGEVPRYSSEAILQIRLAFLTFSLVVAVATFLAALFPYYVSHAVMSAFALAALVGGVMAWRADLPGVLAVAQLVLGALLAALVPLSFQGNRAAWSFLLSIAAVLAIVTFFGAPKVRNVLDIGLWSTLTFPGLATVAMVAFISIRERYRT